MDDNHPEQTPKTVQNTGNAPLRRSARRPKPKIYVDENEGKETKDGFSGENTDLEIIAPPEKEENSMNLKITVGGDLIKVSKINIPEAGVSEDDDSEEEEEEEEDENNESEDENNESEDENEKEEEIIERKHPCRRWTQLGWWERYVTLKEKYVKEIENLKIEKSNMKIAAKDANRCYKSVEEDYNKIRKNNVAINARNKILTDNLADEKKATKELKENIVRIGNEHSTAKKSWKIDKEELMPQFYFNISKIRRSYNLYWRKKK